MIALLLAALVDCQGSGRGWQGVNLVETPKVYSWWQGRGVCGIAIRGMSALWPEHRALALIPNTEGARTVEGSVRFNAEPLRLHDGWFEYYTNCDQECVYTTPQIVSDSSWCFVMGADHASPSMLLACIAAPNGVEGGVPAWKSTCDATGQQNQTSMVLLVYVDRLGARHYESALIPVLPLEGSGNPWISLKFTAKERDGRISARAAVSYAGTDGLESHEVSASFVGSLNADGLAGVQPGMMPQTFCTGYYGRPVRSLGLDWVRAE